MDEQKPKLKGQGGPGRGGGRKPGGHNKRTVELMKEYAGDGKVTPLDFFMEVLRAPDAAKKPDYPNPLTADEEDWERYRTAMFHYHTAMRQQFNDKMECAKAAAPFMHARLQAIEHSGSIARTHEEALEELDGD